MHSERGRAGHSTKRQFIMSTNTGNLERVSRRAKRQSAPSSRSNTSPNLSLGEVYLETFDPPALASTSDVYRQVYASVRAILQRFHWRHAPTAVKAAWDAAASYVTRSLATSGGATNA
jgi:hypothetical protein